MLAVIRIGGKQYLVQPKDKIKVEKIDVEEGADFVFKEVLMVADDKNEVTLGAPLVKGVKVEAKVLKNARAKKVTIIKHKSKKRYKKKQGHKQSYTEVEIVKIEPK